MVPREVQELSLHSILSCRRPNSNYGPYCSMVADVITGVEIAGRREVGRPIIWLRA